MWRSPRRSGGDECPNGLTVGLRRAYRVRSEPVNKPDLTGGDGVIYLTPQRPKHRVPEQVAPPVEDRAGGMRKTMHYPPNNGGRYQPGRWPPASQDRREHSRQTADRLVQLGAGYVRGRRGQWASRGRPTIHCRAPDHGTQGNAPVHNGRGRPAGWDQPGVSWCSSVASHQ